MNIVELIKSEEGKTLEFKQDISSPRNILKTLIEFANTAGGILLIGVEDKTGKPNKLPNKLEGCCGALEKALRMVKN